MEKEVYFLFKFDIDTNCHLWSSIIVINIGALNHFNLVGEMIDQDRQIC